MFALLHVAQVSIVDGRSELEKTAAITPNAALLLRICADEPSVRCQLGSKYGAVHEDVVGILSLAAELNLNIVGVSFHVASGAESPAAFEAAIAQARKVFDMAESFGFKMTMLDIGGGMVSRVSGAGEVTFAGDVHVAINATLDELFPESSGVSIIAGPGRFFAEPCAVMATTIFGYRERNTVSHGKVKDYYVTGGLHGSFNSATYDAHPTCEPLRSPLLPTLAQEAPKESWARSVVFGPTCKGLDTVSDSHPLPDLRNGDWLIFPNMGAGTIAGASNFNGIKVTHIPTFYVYSA